MAVKTLTIDMAAYRTLAAHKKEGESFSMVIKRCLGPAMTAQALRAKLKDLSLSEEALDHVDEIVRKRSKSLLHMEPI